jgi:hypothetical protein
LKAVNADGQAATYVKSVTLASVPAQLLLVPQPVDGLPASQRKWVVSAKDAWGNPVAIDPQQATWSVQGGAVANGVVTASGPGPVTVTVSMAGLLTATTYTPGPWSAPGMEPPQMSVVVSDGLTGDRVDTVDGVLTYLTKASSVEVTVTGEGGNVAVETVEIEGGSGGLMSGPLGAQRVALVEGVTELVVRARCRRVETQESLTWRANGDRPP